MITRLFWIVFASLTLAVGIRAQAPSPTAKAVQAIEQLRHVVGDWNVTTEIFALDGSVQRKIEGTYRFRWVVKDRVLSGEADQPELSSKSAILFYVHVRKELMEMASVGEDGHLWVMTGPADSEVRTTPETKMSDGSTMTLRFTRYDVEKDRFRSKMEYSTDGGKTWVQGNRQEFRRKTGNSKSAQTGKWSDG